jgi:hypothetical protein
MERFCGLLQRAVKGRRFVWASIANAVLLRAQLAHVRNKFNLFGDMSINLAPPPTSGAVRIDGCKPPTSQCDHGSLTRCRADPEHFLLGQKVHEPGTLPQPLLNGIAAALSTRLSNLANTEVVPAARVRPLVKDALISSFTRLQIQSGGDAIRTAPSSSQVVPADYRDATFVRVRTMNHA